MIKKSTHTGVLTNRDLDKIAGLLDQQFDKRIAPFVKDEIGGSETRVKGYINEGIETVMTGLDDLSKQMADKEKVERLVQWAKKASGKIGVRIEI